MKGGAFLIILLSGILVTQSGKSPGYPEPEPKEPVLLHDPGYFYEAAA